MRRAEIIEFLKRHQDDIALLIGVILVSLFSFALGYIVAKQEEKEPIKIEYNRIDMSINDRYNKLVNL
ncbi:MAG: hypothetical protein KJI71_03695 [Patescibacteria group bacterium]|nr:hypothetical protein [Patescibacteria group bacterium]